MITREQRYAADAYRRVQGFAARTGDPGKRSQYESMAQELPVLVRQAGLLQALAFVDRSTTDADRELAEDVAQTAIGISRNDLFTRCIHAPLAEYMRLAQQVMAALVWYKRAAQVVLKKDAQTTRTGADQAGVREGA